MQLYNELMELTKLGNFYFKDQVSPNGLNVRMFSYHYASYNDWLHPSALECRGIMFVMNGETPMEIIARPMEKFFNVNETPFTMGLNFSLAKYAMDKADGSLISTYLDVNELGVKSKMSLYSEQAVAALKLLKSPEYLPLYTVALECAKWGFTLNFEYVAPDNRIVLPYQKAELILLNIRDNKTGEYIDYDEIKNTEILSKYLVKVSEVKPIDVIKAETDIEGYVIKFEDQFVKVKTDWYVALHRLKDSVNNNKALFSAIVEECVDDIRGAIDPSDEYGREKINKFEEVYIDFLKYSGIIKKEFEDHKHLDRKSYALNGLEKFNKIGHYGTGLFGIYMQLFLEQKFDEDKVYSGLGTVFLKNFEQFVPVEYLKLIEVQDE